MARNIMLSFLSTIPVDNNSKIVRKTNCQGVGEVHGTSETAVRYMIKGQGVDLAKLFVFSTKLVRKVLQYMDAGKLQETTHLDYFRQRLADVLPNDEEHYFVCEYDEDKALERYSPH